MIKISSYKQTTYRKAKVVTTAGLLDTGPLRIGDVHEVETIGDGWAVEIMSGCMRGYRFFSWRFEFLD